MPKCQEPAVFRYTWPGRDESYCCAKHADKIRSVASALGFYIQLIPLDGVEACSQEVKSE